jgi:thiol-disulfide isomerase/thioredoxin
MMISGNRHRLIDHCRIAVVSFILLLTSAYALEGQGNDEYDYFDPQSWLLGDFSYNDMLNEPHGYWFSREFSAYELDPLAFMELEKTMPGNIDIVIVLGTWCPDSRREVPRFMKIIETLGFDKEKIRFIGVDSYKEAPLDEYESFDIERVPTFIFYDNKIELGRIIEYPEASLEKDMLRILTENE